MEPTKSELEIPQVLWKHEPSTLRFVNDILNEKKRAAQYSSTLKLMQLFGSKNTSKEELEETKYSSAGLINKDQIFCPAVRTNKQ